MKARILSLAVLLAAGAAEAALAQDQTPGQNQGQHQGGERGGRPAQPQAPAQGWRGGWRLPNAPPAQAQAQQPAPPQAQPAAPAHDHGGGRPGGWDGARGGGPPAGWSRPQGDQRLSGWNRQGGERPPQTANPGPAPQDPRLPQRPDGDRDWRRDGGERRPDWDRNREGERDRGRDRDWNRDWNRDRGEWSRDHDDRRRPDWNRDRDDGRRWRPHVYPPSYRSPYRYRGYAWRPPSGYYVRVWQFGEVLPRGWYEPDYWIDDWWDYGLPEPPPGYAWVRVGSDAVLVEEYGGRIVQIVRFVFW